MKAIQVDNNNLQHFLNKPKKLKFDRPIEFRNINETFGLYKYDSWLDLVCDLNVSQSIYMNKIHFKYIMENTSKLDITFETLYNLVNAKCLDINNEDFEYILNICLSNLFLNNHNIVQLGSYLNEIIDKFDYDYDLEQLSIIKQGFNEYSKLFVSQFHDFKIRNTDKINNLITRKKNDLLLSKVDNNKIIRKVNKI